MHVDITSTHDTSSRYVYIYIHIHTIYIYTQYQLEVLSGTTKEKESFVLDRMDFAFPVPTTKKTSGASGTKSTCLLRLIIFTSPTNTLS